jgi:hypothetical protein
MPKHLPRHCTLLVCYKRREVLYYYDFHVEFDNYGPSQPIWLQHLENKNQDTRNYTDMLFSVTWYFMSLW